MMRKNWVFGFFIGMLAAAGILHDAAAQTGAQHAFRVAFTDKVGAPPLTPTPPHLSARALQRRAAFGIALDETDRLTSPRYEDTVLQATGGIFHLRSRWFNYIVVLVDDSADILAVTTKPWVRSVEYVGYFPTGLHGRTANNKQEPVFSRARTVADSARYGVSWTQIRIVNGHALHDRGYTGAGKLIAVLDAGFTEVHSHSGFAAMRAAGRLVDSFNFVFRHDSVDREGYHGTQVLSLLGGYLPGQFVGSAPDASYAIYATEANGSEQPIEIDNLVAGTERADSIGADIVHASLGYNTFNGPPGVPSPDFSSFDGKTTLAARAANAAARKGMLFTVAAGNEGTSPWNRLLTPGDADSALSVGSVDASGNPQVSSSYGPNAAGRVKPDVSAMGVAAAIFSVNNTVGFGTGTSFAAPQIAGYAACLWQAAPTLKPLEIIACIGRSGDRYAAPSAQLGYGIADFEKVLTDCGPLTTDFPTFGGPMIVAPNPILAGTSITLFWNALPQSTSPSAVLYDATGRAVWRGGLSFSSAPVGRMTLELGTTLTPGIYLLRLEGWSSPQVLKISVR